MIESTAAPRLPLRPLGATGLRVSPLGLATLSVPSWGRRRPSLSPEQVEAAFHEHGVNTFLVHFAMRALCEGVARLVRAGHRDELVLVSEVGVPFGGSVRRGLARNLRALGTDHLDVWLLGWVRKRWYVRDAVWGEMRREKEAGQVRALGFSCHDRPLAAALAKELPADVAMIRYNAAHRGAEREVLAPLMELGASRPGVIAYTATRWGMLLKPLPERGFPEAMSAPDCYRFALSHPGVDMAWCAAGTPEELRADVEGVLRGPLDGEARAAACRFGDAVHEAAQGGFKWMFGTGSA